MNFFNFSKKKSVAIDNLVEEPTTKEKIAKKLSELQKLPSHEVDRVKINELFDLVKEEVEVSQELEYLKKFILFIENTNNTYLIDTSLEEDIQKMILSAPANETSLKVLYFMLINYITINQLDVANKFIDMSKAMNSYELFINHLMEQSSLRFYGYPDEEIVDLVLNALTIEANEENMLKLIKLYNKNTYKMSNEHDRIIEFLITCAKQNDKNVSHLKDFCKKNRLYEENKVFEFFVSQAQQSHNFDFVIEQYRYRDIVEPIISSSKETGDYKYVIEALRDGSTSAMEYLLSKGQKDEVLKYISECRYSADLNPFFKYCVSNDNESNLKDMIYHLKKFINNRSLPHYNNSLIQYLREIEKDKLFKLLKELNKEESSIENFVIVLYLEADTILKDYQEVNFSQNPEVDTCSKSWQNSYTKFYSSIKKVIKSGKATLALYILNKYGGYSSQGDAKLWIDSYVEAFVMLERVDVLAKHYIDFVVSSQNIELLQRITEYYIKEKKAEEALIVLKDIEKLEPKYPFIKSAKPEIERLKMIHELSQNNLDIESINTLKGEDFEKLLMQKFEGLGFKVIETPITGDFGADIIVDTKDETRFVIQCKRFKSKVNLKAVQEVVGALPHYNGDIGIVITNSGFLTSAIKLAESNDIELWDNLKLMKFLTGDISFSQLSEL